MSDGMFDIRAYELKSAVMGMIDSYNFCVIQDELGH